MVFCEVEQRRRTRPQRPRGFKLIARELQHPRRRCGLASSERLEHRRPDVAGDLAIQAGASQQMAYERSDRRLAVRAGDSENRGVVMPCEQFHIPEHRYAELTRFAYDRAVQRQAGTHANNVYTSQQSGAERAGV